MTPEEAKARAKEIAALTRLSPEEAAALANRAVAWAGLGAEALGLALADHRREADRTPETRLRGALALLGTLMTEEAVVSGLDPGDADAYLARQPGFGKVGGLTGGLAEWTSDREPPPQEAPPDDAAERQASIVELRKHPAMLDPAHPEHSSIVEQLVKLHGD